MSAQAEPLSDFSFRVLEAIAASPKGQPRDRINPNVVKALRERGLVDDREEPNTGRDIRARPTVPFLCVNGAGRELIRTRKAQG